MAAKKHEDKTPDPDRRAMLLERLKVAIDQTDDVDKKGQWQAEYDRQIALDKKALARGGNKHAQNQDLGESDNLYDEVKNFVIECDKASNGLIMRRFRIGYARTVRLLNQLEENGVIGPYDENQPRKVLIGNSLKNKESQPHKIKIWGRLEKWQRNGLYILLAVVCITFLLWVTKDSRNNFEWEGDDGVVNIFPIDAASKNYRLKAYIKVDVKPDGLFGFSQGKSYDVDYVFWPNGGKTYFEECEVIPTKGINECLDNDFREWRVEVQKEPEVPASIYDDPS